MRCSKCQSDTKDKAKFCGKCGAKLFVICSRCGSENTPGNNFCEECGQDLTLFAEPLRKDLSFDEKIAKIQRYLPEGLTQKILSQRERIEGEKKQVTVMFCDMEGFTGLTERLGPEEAYSIMDQVYEILIHKVHDYEGTVNEMTGDGIVALFGAPIALEDAPQRAIRSAMAIHREMTRFSERMRGERAGIPVLKMRIGIHSGPVVVGTLGNDLRVEFKAVGDTVNLASRMEELARPGTTYVTEETFKLTEGFFRFESLGGKEIKGKEEPVNVYQVIAPSTRRTRFDVSAERGLTPFVGRERELEILLDGFERAKAGRGQAFSIVAEAGLGKSRLLYEFRKAVSSEDITFLEGRCLSYGRGIAYHPFIDILKANFDIREADGTLQIIEKVREGLRLLETDETSTLPYVLDLLSVEENGIDNPHMTPEGKKGRTIDAIGRIILKGSELRPLILAFEDLHWVDKSSEDVLKSTLEKIPGAGILLIFTYRPEYVHTWGGKSYHSQLNVNRLSNRESLAMVTHLLGTGEIDRQLEEIILEKTEGVPFFLEEFVRSLLEMKIIQKEDNKCLVAKNRVELTIPSTIQDVIMARLDSLPEGSKEVLQAGAVIDREFNYDLIRRVTNLSEQELLSRLSALRESELLYERGIYPQSTYIFKHALTQEVAYGGLLHKKRKYIHGRIGEAIEELYSERLEEYYELLAYHYLSSDHELKALDYLVLANEKTASACAMEEANRYFDQAMELLERLPETEENRQRRISLVVNQLIVFEHLLRLPEYYEILIRVEPLTGIVHNPGLVGEFYARMAHCQYTFGSFDQGAQSAKKSAELCLGAGKPDRAGYAHHVLEWTHLYRGDYDKTIAMKDQVLKNMDKRINLRTYVRALLGAGWAYLFCGQWAQAIAQNTLAMNIAEESSDSSLICWAASALAITYAYKGEFNRGIRYGELALDKAQTPFDRTLAEQFLAITQAKAGRTEEALPILASGVEVVRAGRYFPTDLTYTAQLIEGYFLAGRHDKADDMAQVLLAKASPCGARWYTAWAWLFLGEVALVSDVCQAESPFEEAIDIFKAIGSENFLAAAYSGMGRLHKRRGNTTQAREYLTKALEIFEKLGTLIEPDKVRKELAELDSER